MQLGKPHVGLLSEADRKEIHVLLLCQSELQHEALACAQVAAQDIEHLRRGDASDLEGAPELRPWSACCARGPMTRLGGSFAQAVSWADKRMGLARRPLIVGNAGEWHLLNR